MQTEEHTEPKNEIVDTTDTTHPASVLASIKAYASRFKTVPKRPLRVLIVDDEEPVRRLAQRVLVEAGYETATAADGPEAIERAREFEPVDLLLTDWLMPQMVGHELARRLRESEPSLKVLYMTGYTNRLFDEKGTLWEDEAFLEKPFSVKGLVQAVSLLTSGRVDSRPA